MNAHETAVILWNWLAEKRNENKPFEYSFKDLEDVIKNGRK